MCDEIEIVMIHFYRIQHFASYNEASMLDIFEGSLVGQFGRSREVES